MGNKNQTASKSVRNQYQYQNPHESAAASPKQKQFELSQQKENVKKNSIKRHLSSSSRNLVNRSSSSPVIANKWRLGQMDQSDKCNQFEEICTLTRSPLTSRSNKLARAQTPSTSLKPVQNNSNSIIELNHELKSQQESLTSVIKRIDSTHTSRETSGSKLYRPNSLLTSKPPLQSPNRYERVPKSTLEHKCNTLPISHTTGDFTCYNDDNFRSTQTLSSSNKNLSKSKQSLSNGKLNKRFGLSPRFKRKIVETITNRNSIFSQSRLLQALQSQWNLFASPSQRIGYKSGRTQEFGEYDDAESSSAENPFEHRRQHRDGGSTATFLSTSLMRNSFRYASRRKYKTQSLANPYRHANTNYPVYIHEALFMPEFSVKGQVTEADFEILDVISRGAFGHVIKVKKKLQPGDELIVDENSPEQIYAMKIMWKSQVIRDRALQQVKDEVTIATSCVDNPLIVKTWFYWQSKRFLYIITDYVENGELLSLWLKVHHFPERLVAVYAIEMCLVLDYLHRNGIIYRDIKMENILLDKRGHVQLIDFGLSKWLPMGDRTCTICGTIQYMAPEILSVEPYDHSVDWWSLGILIYALLSGEYPLSAAKDHIQMNEKVSRHVFELSQTQGRYTGEACDLVRKLLRKNPHRRMKSLGECKQDGFFQKEINLFTHLHGETPEQELFIAENYWNPYFIIQNYAPLQLLFDEIYTSRVKSSSSGLDGGKKLLPRHKNVEPSPPPPPPPPLGKDSNSSSSATSSSSCSATRTTTSMPNSSGSGSDDVVVGLVEETDSVCFERRESVNRRRGRKFDDDGYDEAEDDYDDVRENDHDDLTGFTKF